ncbi:MAG: DUF362 domain-containing protein [Candidatus Geothermincolia bacterium]
MSEVFFADMRTSAHRGMPSKMGLLFESAGLQDTIAKRDLVAIKAHFGERGGSSFVPGFYLRELVRKVKELGGKPFLTDANTLYVGGRANAVDHVLTAAGHGFDLAAIDAPIIIADGLTGGDFVEVAVSGKHFARVKIASAAVHADVLLVVSHLTGHEVSGFGAALKNVGMGLGSRGGKQQMHSSVRPAIDEGRCNACGRCIRWCPGDAISIRERDARSMAVIDEEACLGCGECTAMCVEGAISIRWGSEPDTVQERIAEYAAGVLAGKAGKIGFFNFLTQITPSCDCWDFSDAPIVPDIGILCSRDMVAVDQASWDLTTEAVALAGSRAAGAGAGVDKFTAMYPVSGEAQLRHAEWLGLGSR